MLAVSKFILGSFDLLEISWKYFCSYFNIQVICARGFALKPTSALKQQQNFLSSGVPGVGYTVIFLWSSCERPQLERLVWKLYRANPPSPGSLVGAPSPWLLTLNTHKHTPAGRLSPPNEKRDNLGGLETTTWRGRQPIKPARGVRQAQQAGVLQLSSSPSISTCMCQPCRAVLCWGG